MFEEGLRTDGISPCSVRHHRHRAGVGRHDGCRAAVGHNDGHDDEQLVGDDDNHQTSHDALHTSMVKSMMMMMMINQPAQTLQWWKQNLGNL